MPRYYQVEKIFFLLFWLFLLSFPLNSSALILQQNYPQVRGIGLTSATSLPELASYIYYLFIMVGGIVAFWGLIMGGFQWLTSAGNPGRLSRAKNQVLYSFLGLIILLSSWIILHTLDPSLIALPILSISIPEPIGERVGPFQHGYILHIGVTGGLPQQEPIPISEGLLQVRDTSEFDTLPLGGPIAGDPGWLERIVFYNPVPYKIQCDRDNQGQIIPDTCCERDENGDIIPDHCCQVDPATEQILPGTCNDYSYYYGVICFSEPNFEGEAMVVTSYSSPSASLIMPGPKYCRSLYSFKQPATSTYSRGDQIIFYEKDFPVEKDPETGRVIGGACIKINNTPLPEDCNVFEGDILEQDYRAVNGIFEIPCLRGITEDEKGNIIDPNGWFPRSLDLITDRAKKYLIILYQGGFGGKNCQKKFGDGPFRGNAYMIDRKVQDFRDSGDSRLWWVEKNLEPFEPHSAQILPLETIE